MTGVLVRMIAMRMIAMCGVIMMGVRMPVSSQVIGVVTLVDRIHRVMVRNLSDVKNAVNERADSPQYPKQSTGI